jgi:hypothetical protein
MASKKPNPHARRGVGVQEGFSSDRRREPYTPRGAGALAALKRSLAGATEPALRERLTAAIASFERGAA